ncbi:MAG: hypothetical protein LBF97_05905 [Elusimicrobiota bacterium]|jgi:hypothetical protein|nr:hypothetical protein [Elusimicrobiota bacterium]
MAINSGKNGELGPNNLVYEGDKTNFIESEGDVVGGANNKGNIWTPYGGATASETAVLANRSPEEKGSPNAVDMTQQEPLGNVFAEEGGKNVFNNSARISIQGNLSNFPGGDDNPSPMAHTLFGTNALEYGREDQEV